MEKTITHSQRFVPINPGTAYWERRHSLAKHRDRISKLFEAVGHGGDLFLSQWAQLISVVLDFQPDLIVELGRGRGNSTCAFTEAMNQLGGNGTIISLCLSNDWETLTRKKVAQVVPAEWFRPLQIFQDDILSFDYAPYIEKSKKCLVFWDAHGFDIAECVLGTILPLILEKEHLIIMHDLSDARFSAKQNYYYGNNGLWKGNNWDGPRLRLGRIDTAVEQAIAVLDFTTRNEIVLHSADESIRSEIGKDEKHVFEMQNLLGELFSQAAHWFYFTLNERSGTFTFPAVSSKTCSQENPNNRRFLDEQCSNPQNRTLPSILREFLFDNAKKCLRSLRNVLRSK